MPELQPTLRKEPLPRMYKAVLKASTLTTLGLHCRQQGRRYPRWPLLALWSVLGALWQHPGPYLCPRGVKGLCDRYSVSVGVVDGESDKGSLLPSPFSTHIPISVTARWSISSMM